MKVKLEVYRQGPYIKAPEHCPYKYTEFDAPGVNSSLCPLCKLCDFTVDNVEELKLLSTECANYLTLLNEDVYRSITKQSNYLVKQNRIAVAILISAELFDMMINIVYRNESKEQRKLVRAHFINNLSPICFILGSPVYLSLRLTKSQVQVVGEVEWQA